MSAGRDTGTREQAAMTAVADVLAERRGLKDYDGKSSVPFVECINDARAVLDALLAPRTETCPTCWGRVNDIAPGAKCKNPDCSNGQVSGAPLVVLTERLEQVGWFGGGTFGRMLDDKSNSNMPHFGWEPVYRLVAEEDRT